MKQILCLGMVLYAATLNISWYKSDKLIHKKQLSWHCFLTSANQLEDALKDRWDIFSQLETSGIFSHTNKKWFSCIHLRRPFTYHIYKNILVNSEVKGIFFYSKIKSHLNVYLCTGLALNFKQIFNSTQYLGLVVKAGSSNGQPAGLLRLNFLGKKVMLGKRWTMGLVRSMMALLDP